MASLGAPIQVRDQRQLFPLQGSDTEDDGGSTETRTVIRSTETRIAIGLTEFNHEKHAHNIDKSLNNLFAFIEDNKHLQYQANQEIHYKFYQIKHRDRTTSLVILKNSRFSFLINFFYYLRTRSWGDAKLLTQNEANNYLRHLSIHTLTQYGPLEQNNLPPPQQTHLEKIKNLFTLQFLTQPSQEERPKPSSYVSLIDQQANNQLPTKDVTTYSYTSYDNRLDRNALQQETLSRAKPQHLDIEQCNTKYEELDKKQAELANRSEQLKRDRLRLKENRHQLKQSHSLDKNPLSESTSGLERKRIELNEEQERLDAEQASLKIEYNLLRKEDEQLFPKPKRLFKSLFG